MTSSVPNSDTALDIDALFTDDADRSWAHGAWLQFTLDDVDERRAEEALQQAAALRASSGQSCDDLFGPARSWALATCREWAHEGIDHLCDAQDTPLWTHVAVATVPMMFAALAFAVLSLLDGASTYRFALGAVLLPGAIGLVIASIGYSYERLLWRHARWVTVLIATVVAGVGIGGATAVVLGLTTVLWTGSPTWWFAVAAGYAVCGAAAVTGGRAIARRRPPRSPLPDADWYSQAGAALRVRRKMSDARVADVMAQARAEAADAGTDPAERFGPPMRFAAAFPVDAAAAKGRESWYYGVAGVAVLGLFVALWVTGQGVSWPMGVLGALFACNSITARHQAGRRQEASR